MENSNLVNKIVLMRVDWNLSLTGNEKSHREINDVSKVMESVTTINHIFKYGVRNIHIITHQGRPGSKGFTSTKLHANLLSRVLKSYGISVKYAGDFDDGMESLENCLKEQRKNYVYVWDNIRKLSDETEAFKGLDIMDSNKRKVNNAIEERMKNIELAKLILKYCPPDNTVYVNDAFATHHRVNQLTVGPLGRFLKDNGYTFFYGPSFNDEMAKINLLKREMNNSKVNFFFGGAKIKDYVKIIPKLLKAYPNSHVFSSGPLALAFLKFGKKKDIGEMNQKLVKEIEGNGLGEKLADVYKKYKSRIHLPSSFMGVEECDEVCPGKEVERDIDSLKSIFVVDIGEKAIEEYEKILKVRHSAVNLINGGCGFHEGGFVNGTLKIFEHTKENGSFVAVVGGDANTTWNKHGSGIGEPDIRTMAGKAFLNAIFHNEIPLKTFMGV